jgi:hypothetical protein
MGAPLGFDLKSIVQVCVTPAPAPAMWKKTSLSQ